MQFKRSEIISKFKELYKNEFGSLSYDDSRGYQQLGFLIEVLNQLREEKQIIKSKWLVMIKWYKHLSINQRINLKLCFEMLVGVEFGRLGQIFSLRERIEIAYTKLKKEGFDMSILIS